MYKTTTLMSATTPELQNKILEDFLHYFLPDGLLPMSRYYIKNCNFYDDMAKHIEEVMAVYIS